jgi:hypothetical protein
MQAALMLAEQTLVTPTPRRLLHTQMHFASHVQ